MDYGLQLYSVRDFTQKDLRSALKKVSEIGYRLVEFAGFFGNSAEDVKQMLSDYNLTVSGTHSSLADLDEDFGSAVAYHHTIGNSDYIVPGAPFKTKAEVYETIEKFNKYQPMLAKEGIRLAYHNHSGEFLPNEDGLFAHELFEKNTDIDFEIDTYWAFVAGRDPLEVLDRLKDRVHFIHLKDGLQNGSGFALGEGVAPVKEVRQKAIDYGMKIIVESETLQPDGISEVTRCFNFLKTLD